eukprot:CAMPEP_0169151450 /NCGR_PEP_ID=MMETSP1015-20121227/50838_1 /TAXON_ID=342587 /ORGANISM="Karlodinium micrum, Strain CCMP2283" /LENGTH=218 /DNA_ID=CAMNT_0009220881 /DNA_START=76 /DNA_END=732 /DNA_ORIENTATION=+
MADSSSSSSGTTSLYVAGLPENSTEEMLTQLFSQWGAVKSVKLLPKRDDKPDAAAIIAMETPEQASLIIENVDGKTPGPGFTTPLTVKKKYTNNWGKGSGKGGYMSYWQMQQILRYYKGKGKGWGGSGLSSFPPEKKVWIGGIPEEGVTFKELQAHFPGCKFATVMKGKGAGTGGVAFATAEEATAAIQTLNGSVLGGATLVVDVWTKKEPEAPTESL